MRLCISTMGLQVGGDVVKFNGDGIELGRGSVTFGRSPFSDIAGGRS